MCVCVRERERERECVKEWITQRGKRIVCDVERGSVCETVRER